MSVGTPINEMVCLPMIRVYLPCVAAAPGLGHRSPSMSVRRLAEGGALPPS
jgi:hypothetical protein